MLELRCPMRKAGVYLDMLAWNSGKGQSWKYKVGSHQHRYRLIFLGRECGDRRMREKPKSQRSLEDMLKLASDLRNNN